MIHKGSSEAEIKIMIPVQNDTSSISAPFLVTTKKYNNNEIFDIALLQDQGIQLD